jgi:hypothetical protein
MSNELERIAAGLRHVYEGGAWHGPSVAEALAGVTAADAAARPVPSAHTIYELAHHLAAWTGEVTRRLHGGTPGEPAEGDWPDPSVVVDEAQWNATLAFLAARHATLVAAILEFDAARLSEKVGSQASASLGTGGSFRTMLHGLLQHDAYHAGQIVQLKKALRSA